MHTFPLLSAWVPPAPAANTRCPPPPAAQGCPVECPMMEVVVPGALLCKQVWGSNQVTSTSGCTETSPVAKPLQVC